MDKMGFVEPSVVFSPHGVNPFALPTSDNQSNTLQTPGGPAGSIFENTDDVPVANQGQSKL